jgi:putative alpha-1,2-mannosidase
VVITTPQGEINIECDRPTAGSHYIDNIKLNGKASGYRITHKQLLGNTKLEYKLKEQPK